MSNLNPPSPEHLARASSVMEAVSGRVPAARVDYPPFLEEAVAGAAMALEKGHPNALLLTRATKVEDWLDPRSIEGVHLQRAVARVMGGYEPGALVDMSPRGMMEHMVADTVNTTLAARMAVAVKDRSPVMTETMTAAQVARVDRAREDGREAVDLSYERVGAYEKVSLGRRLALVDVFHDMDDVSDAAKAGIARAALDVAAIRKDLVDRSIEISGRAADFREDGVPLFRDQSTPEAREAANVRAEEIALGIGKGPMNEIEAGVAVHVAARGPRMGAGDDGMFHDARVAVMLDVMAAGADERIPSPKEIAMRIDGMAIMMREADDYFYSYERAADADPARQRDMSALAKGEPSSMDADAQLRTFEAIYRGERVPALTSMRIHAAAADLSAPERTVGVDRTEPSKASATRAAIAAQAHAASR